MRILFFAIIALLAVKSFAQTSGSVRGKILDKEMFNEPLLMATVTIKDTEWSDQTNFNGNFEITGIEPGVYTLEVRFLGYEPLELPIEIKEHEQLEIVESLTAKTLSMPIMADSSDKMTSDRSPEPNF